MRLMIPTGIYVNRPGSYLSLDQLTNCPGSMGLYTAKIVNLMAIDVVPMVGNDTTA